MVPIAVLGSRQGGQSAINYYRGEIKSVTFLAKIDAYIVSTEYGFSPLGSNLKFLSLEIGVPENEIQNIANWNRFKNPRVSLIAIKSRRIDSTLRGIILAASESSESYKRFAMPYYGRPYRDFYYNVTYEAIAYVSQQWGARRLAISHLSACNCFHEDIATCNAEALAHYCDLTVNAIETLIFLSDTEISLRHLSGIHRLNGEGEIGQHRPILTEVQHHKGCALIHLDWMRNEIGKG